MAEAQGQERTEQATPKRLREAKEKGQVPRSRELNTVLSLMAAGVGMLLLGKQLVLDINQLLAASLQFDRTAAFSEAAVLARFADTVLASLLMLLPLFALLTVVAVASPLSLGGWVFNLTLAAPKLERVSPISGFGRLFSLRALMELVKALGKFLLVSASSCLVLYLVLEQIVGLSLKPLTEALSEAGTLAAWCLIGFSSTLLLVAGVDVPFQLWQHRRKLRMTRQEVKDELKETEGRPEVKSAIRERQQQFARQRMLTEVPKADVVITNPTHFAVALKYDQSGGGAPKVVAKGRGLIAARIRDLAREHKVVLFSSPPLARALYFSTDLNQEIPRNLFLAVAQVLAYVFQLKQARKQGASRPKPPRDLPVPDEYHEMIARGAD